VTALSTIALGNTNRRRWIALVVVCLAMLMNALDSSIVNVALPSIQRSLHFSQANLTWVVDAYLISLAAFSCLRDAWVTCSGAEGLSRRCRCLHAVVARLLARHEPTHADRRSVSCKDSVAPSPPQ